MAAGMKGTREMRGRGDDGALQPMANCDTLDSNAGDFVRVPRRELEHEHLMLLRRLQQIRRLLGMKPLLTGKEARRRG